MIILRYAIVYKDNQRSKIKVWCADNTGKFRRFAEFKYSHKLHDRLMQYIPINDNTPINMIGNALVVENPIIYYRY